MGPPIIRAPLYMSIGIKGDIMPPGMPIGPMPMGPMGPMGDAMGCTGMYA
jgi:hypothetical protein